MINNKSIGRKLKELRNSRDLKQSELAEMVGLSRPAISNIESGKRSLTLSTLKRFCEVYGIDISYFGIDTSTYDEATDLTLRIESLFHDLPEPESEVFFMRKNLRVAGYARVSTDEQKKYGYSIQAQTEEITQWCNDNDHALQHIYIDEGFSASNMKRPQLQAMLSNLKNLDAIAFTRLARLSRNVLEANKMLELLQQNNVAMISICEDDINTSTANGLFMFNLKVNLAEHELKKGSERIKAVFEYKIAQGQPITGNVHFGYRIATENGNKRIAIDESKAPIVKDIFDSFLLHQSVHHTVEYVNKKYGLSRPYMSYMHILKNEFYAGSYRGNSNYAEPYITKETYNAVQTALQANIRTGIQRHVYLFTGLLRCPECRSKLVGVSHPKDGKRYYYYRCNNAHSVHTCTHKKHYAELATEKYLLSNLDNLLKDHIAQYQASHLKQKTQPKRN